MACLEGTRPVWVRRSRPRRRYCTVVACAENGNRRGPFPFSHGSSICRILYESGLATGNTQLMYGHGCVYQYLQADCMILEMIGHHFAPLVAGLNMSLRLQRRFVGDAMTVRRWTRHSGHVLVYHVGGVVLVLLPMWMHPQQHWIARQDVANGEYLRNEFPDYSF